MPNDPQSQAYFQSLVPQARRLFRQGYDAAREMVRPGDLGSMVELIRHLHRAIDTLSREHVGKAAAGGTPVECAAGCSFCCHHDIMVSAPEAVTIAQRIRAEALALPDLAAHAAAIEGLEAPARYANGLPCPLLQDQRCSVYEDRPEPCRSYLSLSRARCERFMTVTQADGLVILRDPKTVHTFLIAGADWALVQAGFQIVWMELTPFLAQATRPGVCERWMAQEAAFTATPNDDYLARLALAAKAMLV